MHLWRYGSLSRRSTGPFAYRASSRVLSRFSATSFAGRHLCFCQREWHPWKGIHWTNCHWISSCLLSWVSQTLPFTCCRYPEERRKHHRRPKPRIQRRSHEALADSHQWKAKEGQKVDLAKAVGLTSQQVSLTKPWIGDSTETTPVLGVQSPKWMQQSSKGIHLCAEPGCFKPHSLQDHRWSDHSFTQGWSFSGKQISQVFALEVFAGTARLTACLKSLGLVDSVGIDCTMPTRLNGPIIKLDLSWWHPI